MKCKSILTVLDFSDNTARIMDYSIEFAKAEESSLCLLHSEPPITGYAYISPGLGYGGFLGFGEYANLNQEVESIHLKHDRHALELLQKKVEEQGINVEIRLLQGELSGEIRKTVKEIDADLIIMGSHSKSFFEQLMSENPEKTLLRTCSCPLLLIPDEFDN